MSIVDDRGDSALGTVSGLFLHPDLGTVEGLFVRGAGEQFLAVQDIVHWGKTIVIRDEDVLSPLEERVRLVALWGEGRRVLDQKIITESGRILGRCRDVQFETVTFRLEWIFPRKFFRWGRALPASAILEVRPEGIMVRESELPAESVEVVTTVAADAIDAIATTPAQG